MFIFKWLTNFIIEERRKYNSCDICHGTRRIEVIVMGTDTSTITCPHCQPTEKQRERFLKIQEIKNRIKKQRNK